MAVPNLWRTKKQRYSLQGEVCTRCATVMFPPRPICPHCSHVQTTARQQQAEPAFAYAHVYTLPQAAGMLTVPAAGDD